MQMIRYAGMLPLARELLQRGTTVFLTANSGVVHQ